MNKKYEALDNAKARGDDWRNFRGMDNPVCPHCGGVYLPAEHDAWRVYEEGEHEVTCSLCDQDFTVNTRVLFSFDTDEQS